MTEAEQILYDLFSVKDLGDLIYAIHDEEPLGWIAPKVKLWENACERAYKLLKTLPPEENEPEISFTIKKMNQKVKFLKNS